MAEHEKIVKDGVVNWPDAMKVHSEICNLLHHGGYTGEENSSLKPPSGIKSSVTQRNGNSKSPGKCPFPTRSNSVSGTNWFSGFRDGNTLLIRINIDANGAIRKLKAIQREARKAIRVLRELHSLADSTAAKEDN